MKKIKKEEQQKIIVGAVIVVIGVLAIWAINKNSVAPENTNGLNSSTSPSEVVKKPTPTKPTGTKPSTTASMTYTDALKKYGQYRIQFDQGCQASPNRTTYIAGTKVMFDNRAPVSRTIGWGGSKYTIAAYDYKIFTMEAAKYPATVLVDCDGSQNVATVIIQ